MTTALWLWLDRIALRQHRDPIGFFGEVQRLGLWRSLWPYRLGLMGLCIGLIGLFAWRSDDVSRPWVILTPLLFVFGLVGFFGLLTIPTGTLTTATGWLSFLYLYAFSVPFLLVLLFASLAVFSTPAFVLSFWVGPPFLLAWMLVDVGGLLLHLAEQKEDAKRGQFRLGGPLAQRARIGRQRLLFWLRAGCAGLLLLAALLVWAVYGASGWQGALFLGVAGLGLLRLEATLLALMGLPLVWFDSSAGNWRAAYCGRAALLLPAPLLLGALQEGIHPASQAAILLTLLAEGAAAPSIRRCVARLPEAELSEILLHLSLQPGGAEGLRYFALPLPRHLPLTAEMYARLVEESAKPLDLQRWLSPLSSLPSTQPKEEADAILGILRQAHIALSAWAGSSAVEEGYIALGRFVDELRESMEQAGEEWDDAIWPVALWRHLQVHRQPLAWQGTASDGGGRE